MGGITRKLLFVRNFFRRQKPESSDFIVEEKWIADFSKQKHARFNIKSESSYDANLQKNQFYSGHSLFLGLKKTSCIAWTEIPDLRYRDLVITGSIRIDAGGGYGAGGMFFKMTDSDTYYSLLISNKEYFRLDVIRNGMPFPLIGWTELPLSTGALLNPNEGIDFSIISYGNQIIILIRGRWAADLSDSSIPEGEICFCAASYEDGDPSYKMVSRKGEDPKGENYTTRVYLESLMVESRFAQVSAQYEKWYESEDIDPKARVNLAETFAAMNQYDAALTQLRKCWDSPYYKKTPKELLLAGRLAWSLNRFEEAERYISQCYETDLDSPEGMEALVEMAKILDQGKRFKELKSYCDEALKIKTDDPILWNFLGHAYWNLNENKNALKAYEKAFELDTKNANPGNGVYANGIYAKNAANVYDMLGQKKKALARYLDAGRAFLEAGNYNDLALVVPILLSLGKDNWEGRSLAGKWAFAVEDWKMAKSEFTLAEKLRKARQPKPPQDGAQVFLEALLLIREGKRREALPLLKKAVTLEKNYALFHFRLAENLFLLDNNPKDARMLEALKRALDLSAGPSNAGSQSEGLEGWINNFAAQVALEKGDLEEAEKHLQKAYEILGDLPAVKVNRGLLYSRQGSIDKALEILEADRQEDPEGLLANWAGNLLARAGRLEEADKKYRLALAAQSDNIEYISNHANCLIEQGHFSEADDLLARALNISPSPALFEMISYVAAKKGEYPRAEDACRAALKLDPRHGPSLLSLGWILLGRGRYEETAEVILRLAKLELKEDTAKSRDELRERLEELSYRTIDCASCDRSWKVLKDPPLAPTKRIYAMPPDELPAGTCPDCGKTYCIGCAKNKLDSSSRFICPDCNKSLKLINEGLKKMVYDWAAKK